MKIQVLMDHGSKRAQAREDLVQLAEQLQTLSGIPCYAVHMEIAHPSLSELLHSLELSPGAEVYVIPWFLSSGRHLQEDIPALIEAAQAEFPQLKLIQTPALRDSAWLARAALDLVAQVQ